MRSEKAPRHEGTRARSVLWLSLVPSRGADVPCFHDRSRGFTLTELMVAVVVLIVVIIATSKIFGTASRVTAVGTATASMMTEAAAIERQMRDDFAKLTTEGFFAIRCVAVRNDIWRNPPAGPADPSAPLLNPNLPPSGIIRADQLVFFANGVAPMQTFRPSAGLLSRAQTVTSRLYYGPTFQLRNGLPAIIVSTNSTGEPNHIRAYDPVPSIYNPATNAFPAPTPWHRSTGGTTNIPMTQNTYGTFGGIGTTGAGNNMFAPNGAATFINATQPDVRQTLLARQAVTLIDDDQHNTDWNLNYKTIWPDSGFDAHVTARSIFVQNANALPWGWSREIRNGRLDAAASQLEEVRSWVMYNNIDHQPLPANRRPWSGGTGSPPNDQRTIVQGAVYYPRAERRAPGPNRVDQALTNHVIGSGCSSFTIDWTYDDGVGRVLDDAGNVIDPDGVANSGDEYWGMQVHPGTEQPWFGLEPDFDNNNVSDDQRGVRPFGMWIWGGGNTIIPTNIESQTTNAATLEDYWAVFGYNQTDPLDLRPYDAAGNPNANFNLPWLTTGLDNGAFTPFPSAIRVTMTLHDPEGKLEGGREFQFVIRLPRRTE
jgi:prepilin-type N-terminal cleavage/methylation domain-containing protein